MDSTHLASEMRVRSRPQEFKPAPLAALMVPLLSRMTIMWGLMLRSTHTVPSGFGASRQRSVDSSHSTTRHASDAAPQSLGSPVQVPARQVSPTVQ